MGLRKKIYHYDKDQYVDKDSNLVFKLETLPLSSGGEAYIFCDIYGDRFVANSLSGLRKVQVTYKDIVEAVCKYYDYGHNNPKGFNTAIRSQLIHLCTFLTYKEVNEESKPTMENLADICGITGDNARKMETLFVKSILSDDKKEQEFKLLVNSVSQEITEGANLCV